MQFIDTHIHLQDYKQKCATDIIADMPKFGVQKLLCVSATEEDWKNVAILAQTNPQKVVPAFGLHPWYLEKRSKNWLSTLEDMLQQFPNALVGECGLDKLKNPEPEPQREVFIKHMKLAKKFRRPLLMHAVKSFVWLDELWNKMPQKFVLHSFGGSAEQAKVALKYGAYFSFSGGVLKSKKILSALELIPEDKILLETDGPYQSLAKGEESGIEELPQLLKLIAEVKKEDIEKLGKQIYQNSLEFIKPW